MTKKTLLILLASFVFLSTSQAAADIDDRAPREFDYKASQIEVGFVLDTTGSMGGLIEGAKQKIWSIANQIISAKPTPKLKIGLIGYRDRGDEYITKVFDLTEDIDTVYSNLQKFGAAGGGDSPESVNQALMEAVEKLSWSSDKSVLKIIFLVGDAPPHMDYANDVRYPEVCQMAVRKDLIVNTIQCGSMSGTAPVWKEISRLAEGQYVALSQTGNMTVVSTPYDKRLAELNSELGTTLVPYGSERRRGSILAKQSAAEDMALPAMADRLAFSSVKKEVVGGGGDLVDALDKGSVKLEELEAEELPTQLQGKTAKEQAEYIEGQKAKREKVNGEIKSLLEKRQAYIDTEKKKHASSGDSFDSKVAEIIQEQASKKGIRYETK